MIKDQNDLVIRLAEVKPDHNNDQRSTFLMMLKIRLSDAQLDLGRLTEAGWRRWRTRLVLILCNTPDDGDGGDGDDGGGDGGGDDGGAGNRLVGGFLPVWLCHAKTFATTQFHEL